MTLFHEDELAILVHGYAAIISPDHADFETLEGLLYASTQTRAGQWGESVYLHIQAEVIYTYDRHPHRPIESLPLQVRELTTEDNE